MFKSTLNAANEDYFQASNIHVGDCIKAYMTTAVILSKEKANSTGGNPRGGITYKFTILDDSWRISDIHKYDYDWMCKI